MKLHRHFLRLLLLAGALICFSSVSRANGVSAVIDGTKPVSGVITGQGIDRYTFEVSEKEAFIVSISAVGEDAESVMPSLNLLGPDNEIVDGVGQFVFSRVRGDEPQAGTWTVEVSRGDGGETGGAYELRLIQVLKVKGAPVKFGQEYTGDIFRGNADVYTISGTQDVTARISLTIKAGTGFMPELTVYTPGGAMEGMMGCTEPCNMGLAMQEDGPYKLIIWRNDQNKSAGEYSLSVQREGDAIVTQQAPQLMTAKDVFANPITPVDVRKIANPRRFGTIYMHDTFLMFSPAFPAAEEEEAARNGNPLMQLYLGDFSYTHIKDAVQWWSKAADMGSADARNRLGMAKGTTATDKKYEVDAWYRLTVEQGQQDDDVKQANKYLTGRGASQDFKKAIELYRQAAERGSKVAQFNLAVLYAIGLDTEPDFAEAAKWYEKAAAQGMLVARYNLGELYEHGQGVTQDHAKAAKLYSLAAESGYPPAFYRMGLLAGAGHGMPREKTKALDWLRKAAQAGHVDAQGELHFLEGRREEAIELWKKTATFGNQVSLQKLVEIYRKEGIPLQSRDEILQIYRLSANKNNPAAFAGLGDLFAQQETPDFPEAYFWYSLASVTARQSLLMPDERETLMQYAAAQAGKTGKGLSPEQVAVAKWRIDDRNPKPLTEAHQSAAEIYMRGTRAWQEGDYASALVFYLQGDRDNIAHAQKSLAFAYEIGVGFTQNITKSIEYYKKAVRNGHVGSATSIGNFYYFGIGVPRDINEAAKWYEMDASRGYRPAINYLGLLYLYEMKDSAQKAIAMYEKAADREVLEANDALGMIYLYGVGVAQDHAKALKWYLKAANKGSPTGEVQASFILAKYEPRDYGLALKLISTSLDPVALNNRAYMYEHGLGSYEQATAIPGQPQPQQPTALELYRAAAQMCYGRSMYHIGRLMEQGVKEPAVTVAPIKKNAALAGEWMIRAARYGSTAAAFWLDQQKAETKKTINPPPEEVGFRPDSCDQKE